MMKPLTLTALLVPLAAGGCSPAAESGSESASEGASDVANAQPWFEEVTEALGVVYRHDVGALPEERGEYFLPQIIGSGGAFIDYDGDGRLDLFFVNNGGSEGTGNRLFHQEEDGRFKDVSAGSGLEASGYGMGVAIGDVSNDGRPDVIVTELDGTRLFVNLGGGKFQESGPESGIVSDLWGVSTCLFDYDRDGWLDLAVANYLAHDGSRICVKDEGPDYCGPAHYPGTIARVFRNLGTGPDGQVRFEDATESSGVGVVPGPGLGIVCADLTGDRWPDILIANDNHANHLWVNQQDGTFIEEGVKRGLAFNEDGAPQGNMGVTVGDVDGDGITDVFMTHLAIQTHTLWRQSPPGRFKDMTRKSKLNRPLWQSTGFGTVLLDFDLDGDLDVGIVNGGVIRRTDQAIPEGVDFWDPYRQRNQLLENDGTGSFRDVSEQNLAFSGNPGVSRGLAWGDFDSDGDLDLLVTRTNGPASLFRNIAPDRGNWLNVSCVLPQQGGRDAYGAEVRIMAGGRERVSLVCPGQSYLVSGEPRAHFGLGDVSTIESIRVAWPDGSEEDFPGGAVNRSIVLEQGQGTAAGG